MKPEDFRLRRANNADTEALGRLGASLLRSHYEFDRRRFMAPGENVEAGYGWFLTSQVSDSDSLVLVAEAAGTVIGYVYAAIEPRSWKELREEAGFVHDLVVDETMRGRGIGSGLLEAALEWFRERGMPRVVLWTAQPNEGARRLFARVGFRPTMVEMTRELDS